MMLPLGVCSPQTSNSGIDMSLAEQASYCDVVKDVDLLPSRKDTPQTQGTLYGLGAVKDTCPKGEP